MSHSPGDKFRSAEFDALIADLYAGQDAATGGSLIYFRRKSMSNHVLSGGVGATSPSLTTTITAVEAYVNGKYSSKTLTSHAFTPSKDTYVDLKDDGTLAYVEVTNGATSGMTLTLNADGTPALRLGKFVTNGTAVTSVVQYGLDPLANYIYNTSPIAAPINMFTNSGSGGGTFYARNQGGVKEIWGKTASIAVAGAGFQSSATKTILWPTPFFNTAPTVVMGLGQTSNSQYLGLTTITEPDAFGVSLQLLQFNGTNGTTTGAFVHARGW